MRSVSTMFFLLAVSSIFSSAGRCGQQAHAAVMTAGATPQPTPGHSPDVKDADRPAAAERNPRYKVNRDDVLSLTFPLSPEFNQKPTVQPDGYINLQGTESLCVLGMTVPEVTKAIKAAYAKTLHEPIVDVDLLDFQKPFFIVSGQVGKPGQYDLRYDITVSEAIAIAGGFTPGAKTQVFLYHRVSPGWIEVKELKLKDILRGKNVNEDAAMRPGDMIYVPEKFIVKFRKYVPYFVGASLNPSAAWF
jgi:polysaccharide export outer membrane protein